MIYKAMIFILSCSVICGCSSLREVTEDDVTIGGDVANLDFVTLDKATNEPFTGVVVKYFPNGKVQSKKNI